MPQTASGLYFEVQEAASPDAPTVLLSSGLGGSCAFWAPQMAALSAFRVIGYDHRGTARSDRRLPEPYSVEAMADDMLEVLDAVGAPRAHVVGHAAGGLAGLALALKAPERVDRLVVAGGWAAPDPHIRRCFDVRLSLLNDSGPEAYVHAQPLFLYPPNWISQHADRLAAEAPHHLAAFPQPQVMRARIAALLAFDVRARLQDIDAPVLVAAAADDMLVPPLCAEALAAGLRNASLDMAPWGGHAFTATAPETFNASLVRFLTQGRAD